MKNMVLFLLLAGVMGGGPSGQAKEAASGTSKVKESISGRAPVWSLTTTNYKEVKVNGLPLKKGQLWTFSSMTQLQTGNADVLVSWSERYYLKINKNTEIRWDEPVLHLVRGSVYVKDRDGGIVFQIPGFFKFKVKPGDFIAEFDASTKTGRFEILKESQVLHIDSDDREMNTLEGTTLSFQPEYVDGDMAYDFLLNDRKIPKLKMEKGKTTASFMDVSQWKVSLTHAVMEKQKVEQQTKVDSSKFICKKPNGNLNTCYFIKEGQQCVRYTCNLNGLWSLKTSFAKNDLCPIQKTVKDCEWLGK